VERDPARKLVLPQTRKPNRPYATPEQIRQIEGELAWKDQIILRLFTRCGLRAGEVFGLQPQDVGNDKTIFIRQTFSRGRLGGLKLRAAPRRFPFRRRCFKNCGSSATGRWQTTCLGCSRQAGNEAVS